MKFSSRELDIGSAQAPNRVILAPMSGITDAPFRRVAEELGAGLVVSEMTACAGLVRGEREATVRSDGRGAAAAPLGAGATAAVTLREEGFDGAIRLIGAETQPPYNRPPLSKGYLRRQETFEAQLVKPADYYAEREGITRPSELTPLGIDAI